MGRQARNAEGEIRTPEGLRPPVFKTGALTGLSYLRAARMGSPPKTLRESKEPRDLKLEGNRRMPEFVSGDHPGMELAEEPHGFAANAESKSDGSPHSRNRNDRMG